MKHKRTALKNIEKSLLNDKKIVVLFGARQTGKTTLSNTLLDSIKGKTLRINADENKYIDLLSSRDYSKIKLLIEGYDTLFIDEAQRIPDLGINLKIIYENMPELKILVTGSSSFDIANTINEPLTGRTSSYKLFPISLQELRETNNVFDIQNKIEEYLIYGLYPGLLNYGSIIEKEKYLLELSNSYLYKDVLELSNIRNSSKIKNLLKLLAFQIGSEVSINELAQNLNMSQETVNSYIDLLEKSFIVFRLNGFSRNLRKEISKRDKILFWDLGVRNSIINNFAPLNMRMDTGVLWENFIIAERLKFLSNNSQNIKPYFWRTYTGAEVDFIEEQNGILTAIEIKYKKPRNKAPQTWIDNYGNNFRCITTENFWEYVM
ncbi:MAG: ATP-binding protein [Prolixibacteraceae bacterium]|jgi:predicted AAA+ superfamily ATPase|nr:ATP-binding protein [Prolixibacteraceae bacterium]